MLHNILQKTVFQNSVSDYLFSVSTFIINILIIQMFKKFILIRLKRWAKETETTVDDFLIHIIGKTVLPLLYYGAFYVGIQGLILHPVLKRIIDILGLVLLTIFGVRFLLAVINYALENYWKRMGKDIAKEQSIKGIVKVVKVVIWGLAIVILLDNLGFKVSTVIAGLGIGGVAVALAAQAILGDLFSYFAMVFDRPFEVGDFIIINDYLGTVEHIGIKTTRIRSLGGEQLIFSNTDLTNSRVRNYKRMDKRRVVFKIGVTYQTTLEQVKQIPQIIKDIIQEVDDTIFDRAHFFSYGDFSLIFEIVYYVIGSDYNKYMDIQQEINFRIKEEFEKRGIEFAYPTQTLYINKIG